MKAIKVKKSDTSYLRSMLKWVKSEKYYDYSLQDLETIDLRSGKNIKVDVPEVKFRVDFHGNFLGSLRLTRKRQHEGHRPRGRQQVEAAHAENSAD